MQSHFAVFLKGVMQHEGKDDRGMKIAIDPCSVSRYNSRTRWMVTSDRFGIFGLFDIIVKIAENHQICFIGTIVIDDLADRSPCSEMDSAVWMQITR